MHGSIGSIGSFDRTYMVKHARKWLIVRETAKTAKTAMRIFAYAWKGRSIDGGIPPETGHRCKHCPLS